MWISRKCCSWKWHVSFGADIYLDYCGPVQLGMQAFLQTFMKIWDNGWFKIGLWICYTWMYFTFPSDANSRFYTALYFLAISDFRFKETFRLTMSLSRVCLLLFSVACINAPPQGNSSSLYESVFKICDAHFVQAVYCMQSYSLTITHRFVFYTGQIEVRYLIASVSRWINSHLVKLFCFVESLDSLNLYLELFTTQRKGRDWLIGALLLFWEFNWDSTKCSLDIYPQILHPCFSFQILYFFLELQTTKYHFGAC